MSDPQPSAQGEMPFLDHLEELRWRLLKAVIAIAAGVVIGYITLNAFDVIGFLKRPINPYLQAGEKLMFTSPIEPFMITLKLSFVFGVIVASPVLIWQAWRFLRPALYDTERRVVVPAALIGILLFLAGAASAFYLVLPMALKVMMGFQTESLQAFITAREYFSLATAIVLAFGAVFELPLLLVLLVYLRIVSAAFLRKQRRNFVILNVILSSIVTPGDIVVMTAVVMIPIQLFYEMSILLASIIERRRAATEEQPAEAIA